MKKMTRLFLCTIIASTYITPLYGITFISGSKPIKENDKYHWWVENSSNCKINITVWFSFIKQENRLAKKNVFINPKMLNSNQRTIITVDGKDFNNGQDKWLNIAETNDCHHKPRLTIINFQ
jgi:hypothetical protein